jgi:hypothetical protein
MSAKLFKAAFELIGEGGIVRLGYSRDDAVENLRRLGEKRRSIAGPVPPSLPDKSYAQGAKSKEEAIMAGTTKYTQDGEAMQIRNYGAPYNPAGQQTRVSTRKSTGRGITAEGNTRKINEALATPDDADERAYFKALANAAKEGLDADHVYDISRIANAVRDMTPERRQQFFDNFKKAGISVGNQEANIQAISKFLNQVVKPQETRELDAALKAMGKREVSLLQQVLNNEM